MTSTRAIIERIKFSPLGRIATVPLRLRTSVPPLLRQAALTFSWTMGSREWTNFSTYYTRDGVLAMAAAIGQLTRRNPEQVRGFATELEQDEVFHRRVLLRKGESRLRFVTDPGVPLGKCLFNYVLVRASRAHQVFEAGTEQGLSSWAICRALSRNMEEEGQAAGAGRRRMPYHLTTVDLHSDRGQYLDGDERGLVQRLTGESISCLTARRTPVDLFIHDTVNEDEHTRVQLLAAIRLLAPGGIIHTSWFNEVFTHCCESQGLAYLSVSERLHGHWFEGRRAGIARRP